MKLRLLLFKNCNRKCEGCCNKDWDLDSLPIVDSFSGYSEIMLTGGEPMINPELIIATCMQIRKETTSPVYLYTAKVDKIMDVFRVLPYVNGITLTLHDESDVTPFLVLDSLLKNIHNYSLRLNIFKGVKIPYTKSKWIIKDQMEWLKNCPLPKDEKFMRLPFYQDYPYPSHF